MDTTLTRLRAAAQARPDSSQRFDDGGQYRIEIPSVESPGALEVVLSEASARGVALHRVSQGSGITLMTDDEISEYAALGSHNGIEVCLFVGPRAAWDGFSAAALTPDGRNVGWRNVGLASLAGAFDDIVRACELGIRSFLVSDEGLAVLVREAQSAGSLPQDLILKASALLGIANPVGARVLADLGFDSINVSGDTPVFELAAYREASTSFIDLYVEGPDSLGGFLRYHDLGEIVRVASPVYLKFGLRNAPGMYPSGAHLESTLRATAAERVRRASIGFEHLNRQYPDAVASPMGRSGPGIPVPAATAGRR